MAISLNVLSERTDSRPGRTATVGAAVTMLHGFFIGASTPDDVSLAPAALTDVAADWELTCLENASNVNALVASLIARIDAGEGRPLDFDSL